MNKKKRLFGGLVLIFGLCMVFLYYYTSENKNIDTISSLITDPPLRFSVEESFHTEEIAVELLLDPAFPRQAEVYYTLNGDPPDKESFLYQEPIVIEKTEGMNVVPVRAVICYKNECSKVFTKTYFVSSYIKERYDIPVISITSDGEGLFGYENGILVAGRIYDEFYRYWNAGEELPDWLSAMKKELEGYSSAKGRPGEEIAEWFVPANYMLRGRENERKAHVEMYGPDGSKMLDQDVGLRVSGKGSATNPQKSLRLCARTEYEEENSKFRFDIFSYGEKEDLTHTTEQVFDKLILRNSGNDWMQTYLVWNLTSRIARQAGFPVVANVRPAAVYINGSYYGLVQMSPDKSEFNIAKMYDLEEDLIEFRERKEKTVTREIGIRQIAEKDLNLEETRQELESIIDMDNLLLYYALEIYMSNTDWPTNNYTVWRYTGEKDENNPYKDGRWRFLLYDTDVGFSYNWNGDAFTMLLEEKQEGKEFFSLLMKSDYYRKKFVNILCDLLAGVCREENVLKILEEEEAQILNELDFMMSETLIPEEVGMFLANREQKMEEKREFITHRDDMLVHYMPQLLSVSGRYELKIKAPEKGAEISFSTVELLEEDSDFQGFYYKNIPLTIKALTYPGTEFEAFLVNGTKITKPEFTISGELIKDGEVTVELLTKESELPAHPVINEIKASGKDEYVELYNPYTEPVSLEPFFISDDPENLKKYACPDYVLKPGGFLVLQGKNFPLLTSYIVNFSIKDGETLYLSNEQGEILEQCYIPKMSEQESYGKYPDAQKLQFFQQTTKGSPNLE